MKSGTAAIMLGLAMLVETIATAQVPGVINYQARLTDANGAPLENDPATTNDGWIDLQFRIYNATGGGTFVWSQETTNVAVYNGLFSVLLSNLNTTVFPATNRVNRWLEVEVITNGVSSILAPRKDFSSVPYAVRAGDADTVDGLHANQLGGITNETDPQVGVIENNHVPRWDGATTQLVSGTIFDDGSRVGVGTTGPNYPLDVDGNAQVRGRMGVEAGVYSDPEYSLQVGKSVLIRRGLETVGNVGIGGGIDSSIPLTVHGKERVTGDLSVQGKVGVGTTGPDVDAGVKVPDIAGLGVPS